eukprot:190772-Chlamydomonas_euryale.AAC.1
MDSTWPSPLPWRGVGAAQRRSPPQRRPAHCLIRQRLPRFLSPLSCCAQRRLTLYVSAACNSDSDSDSDSDPDSYSGTDTDSDTDTDSYSGTDCKGTRSIWAAEEGSSHVPLGGGVEEGTYGRRAWCAAARGHLLTLFVHQLRSFRATLAPQRVTLCGAGVDAHADGPGGRPG